MEIIIIVYIVKLAVTQTSIRNCGLVHAIMCLGGPPMHGWGEAG